MVRLHRILADAIDLGLFADWVRYYRFGIGQASELPLVGWALTAIAALGHPDAA